MNNSGSASPDGKFSLSQLSIETFNQGNDLDLNFDVQVTDSDGDYTVVDNGLHVTLHPTGVQDLAAVNTLAATNQVEIEARAVDGLQPHAGELERQQPADA